MSTSKSLSAGRTPSLIDVIAQFASSIIGRGLYLALQVLLARSLGPAEFGLYAIGWTVVGLVSTLSPLGMPQAVLRYRLGGPRSLVSSAMTVTVLIGTAACVMLLLAGGWIATTVFRAPAAAPIIHAFAWSLPILGVFSVVCAALRTGGAMVASAAIGALLFVAYLALTAVAFWRGPSATGAASFYAIATALATAPGVYILLRQKNEGISPGLGTLVRFGAVTMLIHSANVLNLWADRVVIGILADPIELGIYQVASQLAMVSIVLRTAVTVVFETGVARVGNRGGIPDLTREFFGACRMLLHVSAPGLMVLALTAGFWVRLLFGSAYQAAAMPLMILTVGQIIVSLIGPSAAALHMSGEERFVMYLAVASVILNLVGNFALVPFLGPSGAALACALANFAAPLACLVGGIRTGRVRFGFAWLRDILFAIAAAAAVTVAAVETMGEMNVVKGLFALALAYLCYGAVVALFCSVEDDLLDRARSLLHLPPSRGVA